MNEHNLTKEQIIEELQRRHSMKYLCYLSLQEIMLDYYSDTTFLKNYNNDLKTKFRNMVASLQRNSSQAYRFMQSHKDGEATIRQFHNLTRLFEGLHTAIDNGGSTFVDCLDAVERILIRDGLKEEVRNEG